MKATDILKEDHHTVKKMFAAFEKMGEKAKALIPGGRK